VAGSHRAQRSERTGSSSPVPRRVVVGVAVVVLAAASYLIVDRLGSDSTDSPSHSSSTLPSPRTTATTPATPSATPAPPTPTPSKTRPPVPLTRVAPDAPRRLVAGTLIDTGFDSSVTDLDASSASEVARWESRGSPGSPGTDTVYVIGRVYAGQDSAFAALPRLRVGSRVSVRTDRGTMTYTVSAATLKPEAGLRRDPLFTARQPGRLVLVGIRYDAAGNRLAKALVVTAQLTGAKRA
jgi:hypothetical protein